LTNCSMGDFAVSRSRFINTKRFAKCQTQWRSRYDTEWRCILKHHASQNFAPGLLTVDFSKHI